MGGEVPYTAAERRQMDKDQSDPKWLAWLAGMDEQMGRFLKETVADMPENPWTAEGLRRAEQAALEFFPTVESVDLPENRDLADQFHRFIGETFRRNFGGQWYNSPSWDNDEFPWGFGPVVWLPYSPEYLTVIQLLTATMDRRTGTEWSRIFGYQIDDYAAWKAGRADQE